MSVGALVAIFALLGGLLLVLRCRAGARPSLPFRCPRCGHRGGPPDATAACPRCGATLERQHVTTRRRKVGFSVGVALLLIGGWAAAVKFAGRPPRAPLYEAAPTGWLLPLTGDPVARRELARRIRADAVADANVSLLVERALAVQGDGSRPWEESWGRLLEAAHARGELDAGETRRYIRQSFDLELLLRDEVQLGRVPRVQLSFGRRPRRGPKTRVRGTVFLKRLEIDGESVEVPLEAIREAVRGGGPEPADRISNFSVGKGWSITRWPVPVAAAAETLGEKRIRFKTEIDVQVKLNGDWFLQKVNPWSEWVADTLRVVRDRTARYLEYPSQTDQEEFAGVCFEGHGRANSMPRTLTFRVVKQRYRFPLYGWLRTDDSVVSLFPYRSGGGGGRKRVARGTTYHQEIAWDVNDLLNDNPRLRKLERVDLIVRPNAERAETSVKESPVWLGQWVFEGLPWSEADGAARSQVSHNGKVPTLARPKVQELRIEEMEKKPRPRGDS